MKRVPWIFPALLLFSISARAQAQETASAVPAWEFSGGYSYLDANVNATHFHMNGANATATENVNGWFAGRIEFNGFQGNEPISVSGATTNYSVDLDTITYGPIFSFRKISSRVVPFGGVQAGAAHGSKEFLGISEPAWKFAIAPEVGVDFIVNHRTAIRLNGEYLLTRFLSLTQQHVNVSVGLVLRFGQK